MKFLLLAMVLCILMILGVSCKKSGGDSAAAIPGYWELRFVEGGYQTSGRSGSFSPGNGNILKFTDNDYRAYSDGLARDSGQYQITKDTLSPGGSKMDKLTILHPSYKTDYYYQLSNNTLTLYSGTVAADGTISTYTRLVPSQLPDALR